MSDLAITTGKLTVWPQGEPSEIDDLTADGHFGFLNEQVLWIRHADMPDSRSALRVPESVGWKGKQRVEGSKAGKHHYQDGQQWRVEGGRLVYDDCPIGNAWGESPGSVSAEAELVEEEVLRVRVVVENGGEETLENVTSHFCLNHKRAPLLGEQVYGWAKDTWVDFEPYVSHNPYRHFFFEGRENPADLPRLTERMLLSEAAWPGGPFVTVIASRAARDVMSNYAWPCTDVTLSFGDVEPGGYSREEIYVGVGQGSKDAWRERIKRRLEIED